MTVLPAPQPRTAPDARVGGAVIAALPVVGLLLGAATAAIGLGLSLTDLPDALIGALCVAFGALATRGMHLDGVADTADGLGCYGDPDRVRAVMRSGDVGPFGAATLALVLLVQSLGFGALIDESRWWTIALVIFLGRVAVLVACRRGLPAANADGFGALVAGSQRLSIPVWLAVAAAAAVGVGLLDDPIPGAVAGAVAAVFAVAVFAYTFTRHCARRMGGVSGDVLGATIELSTTLALIVVLV
ncbi:adenosylcobinamide-GDP ribazoletransferase [Gordonia phosphorivorans]|uniref:Adenosylcobinamide-GDP ribazoletransferase n=1 Tax=Gordonia phosphorivorans TaxID=1056982 RepID=A0ABV6H4P2_9ACTN